MLPKLTLKSSFLSNVLIAFAPFTRFLTKLLTESSSFSSFSSSTPRWEHLEIGRIAISLLSYNNSLWSLKYLLCRILVLHDLPSPLLTYYFSDQTYSIFSFYIDLRSLALLAAFSVSSFRFPPVWRVVQFWFNSWLLGFKVRKAV